MEMREADSRTSEFEGELQLETASGMAVLKGDKTGLYLHVERFRVLLSLYQLKRRLPKFESPLPTEIVVFLLFKSRPLARFHSHRGITITPICFLLGRSPS